MSRNPIPYEQFRTRLMREYRNTRRPATIQRMDQVSRIVGELVEHSSLVVKTTADLTPDLVQLYIEVRRNGIPDPAKPGKWIKKPVRQNTIIGELGYLKALCNFAVEELGALERCPFRRGKKLLKPAPLLHRTHLTREEVGRLLEHLRKSIFEWRGHRLYALVSLYAYTGVRKDEGLYVMIEDLRLDDGILLIQERDSNLLKTEKSAAPVGLPPELVSILRPWASRCASQWLFPGIQGKGPWDGGSPGYKPLDRVKAAAAEVGLEDVTIQMFRHSWASNSRWWGISDDEVKEQLRHSDIETQAHYRHEDLKRRAYAVRNVTYRSGTAG